MDFKLSEKEVERIYKKFTKRGENECWDFIGKSYLIGGHCRVKIRWNCYLIHRVMLMIQSQNVLNFLNPKMKACHTCKQNPKCCNPNHLYWGTQQDNINDMVRDETNLIKARGSSQHLSKLAEAQVLEIRAKYAAGNISHRELGREYNVVRTTISCIIRRDTWSHI